MLALRRSTPPAQMTEPGPNADELQALIRLAMRVPDHRRLYPWRFVAFTGEARRKFGERLAEAFSVREPDAGEEALAIERGRFLRAPTVVCVISRVDPGHKTPVWEQELSAGAACMQLLNAANAMGFASVWLTDWCAYDPNIRNRLCLSVNERVAGFVYLGTALTKPMERARAEVADKLSYWSA
jgi:nitroreductase